MPGISALQLTGVFVLLEPLRDSRLLAVHAEKWDNRAHDIRIENSSNSPSNRRGSGSQKFTSNYSQPTYCLKIAMPESKRVEMVVKM